MTWPSDVDLEGDHSHWSNGRWQEREQLCQRGPDCPHRQGAKGAAMMKLQSQTRFSGPKYLCLCGRLVHEHHIKIGTFAMQQQKHLKCLSSGNLT